MIVVVRIDQSQIFSSHSTWSILTTITTYNYDYCRIGFRQATCCLLHNVIIKCRKFLYKLLNPNNKKEFLDR